MDQKSMPQAMIAAVGCVVQHNVKFPGAGFGMLEPLMTYNGTHGFQSYPIINRIAY
jgi:hypothetical protein